MPRLMKKVRNRLDGKTEEGFTIVELMMVVIISLVMMAGMVALVSSAVQLFRTSKDLGAVTDSARRSLASMARVLRLALHFDNSNCTVDKVTFWCDVDNDQSNAADVDDWREPAEGFLRVQPELMLIAPGTKSALGVAVVKLRFISRRYARPRVGLRQ